MRDLRATRQFVLLATLFLSANACRCAKDQPNDEGAAGPKQGSTSLADKSLSDDEYVALGMPAYDKNWHGEEMRQAADQLAAISGKRPGQLPRHGSARSGKMFARMTARSNWAAFEDSTLSAAVRLPAVVEYARALGVILDRYARALESNEVADLDVVELRSAQLHVCRLLLDSIDEYLKTLSTEDLEQKKRVESLEPIRSGMGKVLVSVVGSLTQTRWYGVAARRRLLDCLTETLPVILPRLTPEAREALQASLAEATSDPAGTVLQPALGQLVRRVDGALSAPSSG